MVVSNPNIHKPNNNNNHNNDTAIADDDEIHFLDLNHLTVVGPIGRGAKGVVFRVITKPADTVDDVNDDDDEIDLALKVVSKGNNGEGGQDKRVEFERKVLRGFRHPLVARLRGVTETTELIGYAIDYCPGGDLGTLRKMQSEKMFSDDVIRFYGSELVLALEYLHGLGIIYRDLKPENILIQSNGHIMLVDFDLSTQLATKSPASTQPSRLARNSSKQTTKPTTPNIKRTKSNLARFFNCYNSVISPDDSVPISPNSARIGPDSVTESDSAGRSNSFVGTEEYVAPEMIIGCGHDYAVDWWTLGVVLYEMLYGTTPFKGQNRKETFYKVLTKTPELIGETTPLRDLIRRLLEKDPVERISLEGIKGHDFFKRVDWDLILRLSRPPFIPGKKGVGEVVGTVGLKPADVENVVRGIFGENNNGIENNSISDKKNIRRNIDGTSNGVHWVEGLDFASDSHNFSAF